MQVAYDDLLERVPLKPTGRIQIEMKGGRAKLRAHEAGRVALVFELRDGDLELVWVGQMAPGTEQFFPVASATVVRAVAFWAPATTPARRALRAILEQAEELDAVEASRPTA